MSHDTHVNVANGTRSKAYADALTKINADGVCPFCPEHLEKYHTKPILRTGSFWTVTPNMYPYAHSLHHIILITHRHVTDTRELTPEEWSELHELLQWLIDTLQIPCGTLIMRSGDMEKTGATVKHLHAQFVVGSDPTKPVMTRVG